MNSPVPLNTFQALVQLAALANETEDTGPRVVSLARSALNYLDNESCDVRETVLKVCYSSLSHQFSFIRHEETKNNFIVQRVLVLVFPSF